MKFQIIGKNISITDGISSAVTEKLSRLEKFIKEKDVECRVVVSSHGETAKIEVTIFVPQMTLRAEVTHQDLYAAIDLVVAKLKDQISKLKYRMDRSVNKISLGKSIDFNEIELEKKMDEEDEIVRSKSYYLTPMTIEEAITRMEALGHDFFMYLDSDDDLISVVYIRKDGGYGVIQAENPIQ